MSIKELFKSQLKATAEMIIASIKEIPKSRLNQTPPHDRLAKLLWPDQSEFHGYYGQWSSLRILFHLTYYERIYAIPNMKIWTGKPNLNKDQMHDKEEIAWDPDVEISKLITDFNDLRQTQISLLNQINENQFKLKKSTGWGKQTLEFVVMKTLQHSFEHGNKIMRQLLYWDLNLEFARKTAENLRKNGELINPEIYQLLNSH